MRCSLAVLALCLTLGTTATQAETMITVRPQEIDSVLVNPGMGFTVFEQFHPDSIRRHAHGRRHPRTSIMYTRLYLRDVMPRPNMIDFNYIDSLFTAAANHGQDIALGFMTADYGSNALPQWMIDSGISGVYHADKYFVPKFEDPEFMRMMRWFITEIGRRYDGHPRLDHVDIRLLGWWGEFHVEDIDHAAFTSDGQILVSDFPGIHMPPKRVVEQYVQWHIDAFPRTPLIALINDADGLRYAVKRGVGWRADCLGDLGCWSSRWNHMEDRYPQWLSAVKADSVWQHAPVAFESCWSMLYWYERGWDIDQIFDYALRYHVSIFNNKSGAIPDAWWPAVERFQKRMGYRLVLKEFRHPDTVISGSSLTLTGNWFNRGVAPPYDSLVLSYRVRDERGQVVATFPSGTDFKGFLPGQRQVSNAFVIPSSLPAGRYTLDVGVTSTSPAQPMVKLAIEGRRSDGWYELSHFTAVRRSAYAPSNR